MTDFSVAMLELGINSLDAGATLVKISLKEGKRGVLTVRDNGRGMDKATLKAATDKGFSGKGSEGLGLYELSQGAIRDGGSLHVSSKEGKGTLVRLKARDWTEGDIAGTLVALIDDNSDVMFKGRAGRRRIKLDTRDIKRGMDGAQVQAPKTLAAIKKFVKENFR